MMEHVNERSDWQEGAFRVVAHVMSERARQIGKGWTPEHDDGHDTNEMGDFIQERLNRLGEVGETEDRTLLVQIAALAVAAVERLDRRERS